MPNEVSTSGIFAFDPLTMTCSPPPADFVDMSRRRNAREELIVDFGDAFLFSELISKYDMLSTRSNSLALPWYEGSYARILYPKANLTSQRISDLLSSIGREDTLQRFFDAYLPILGADIKNGANVLVDSTGLPNCIRVPLTAVSNHNGIISEEIRLIYVVQQGSRLPIYMRYVPGNIVDASTLVTTMKELKTMGVNTKFAILDAAYLTEEGMQALRKEKISFITRCPSNRRIYKDLVPAHLSTLEASDNLALDSAGRLFNGRMVYIKCVPVKNYMGMDLYAYIGKDMGTAALESRQYAQRVYGSGEKLDRQAFYAQQQLHGIFMLLSTRNVRAEELLSTYHVRQEIEQVFDISKNYASLLPLYVEKEETQLEIRESKYSLDAILTNMPNQHAKVFQNVVIPSEACRVQNEIYKLLRIHPAKEYPRVA